MVTKHIFGTSLFLKQINENKLNFILSMSVIETMLKIGAED